MLDAEQYLKNLGLEEKEAKLYLHALSTNGQFTVADISKVSGLKRPTCYLILDSLLSKGLVSLVPSSKRLCYQTEPPEVLMRLAERNLTLARKVIPTLNVLNQAQNRGATIKFYSGQNGVRNIYEDTLRQKAKEYKYFGSSKDLIEAAGEDYLQDYIRRRVKLGLKSIGIRVRERETEGEIYNKSKKFLRDVRYAPKNLKLPSMIIMYGDKVAVISTKKENFGFLVESKEFAETMNGLFDVIWTVSDEK